MAYIPKEAHMEAVTFWRSTWSLMMVVGAVALLACQASATGDAIRPCLKACEKTGCAGNSCLPRCQFLNTTEHCALEKLPVYRRWKEWTCGMECRYHCMLSKETEQAGLEQEAIGYRENWCLARVMAHQQSSKDLYTHLAKASFTQGIDLRLINEPASAAFSAVNLLGNLFGLLTFLKFVHYSLPSRPISRGPYYPFAGLWTIYGILVTVYWFAQCIIRSRNMVFDKHIDATFEVVLAGYALLLAIVRVGDLRSEQARVIVMAPCLAFLVPHLWYINLCTFDFGLNLQVCLLLGTTQYLLWIIWAGVTRHPARFQLWSIALVGPLTLFFRLYDLSYLWKVLDTDVLWIFSTALSSLMWWSFATSDADYQTKLILKKRGDTEGILKVDPKKLQ